MPVTQVLVQVAGHLIKRQPLDRAAFLSQSALHWTVTSAPYELQVLMVPFREMCRHGSGKPCLLESLVSLDSRTTCVWANSWVASGREGGLC